MNDEYDPFQRILSYTPTSRDTQPHAPNFLCVTVDTFTALYTEDSTSDVHHLTTRLGYTKQTKPHVICTKRKSVDKLIMQFQLNPYVVYIIVDHTVLAYGKIHTIHDNGTSIHLHWSIGRTLMVPFVFIEHYKPFHFHMSPKYRFASYFSRRDFLDPKTFSCQDLDTTDLDTKPVKEIRAIRFNLVVQYLQSLIHSG